MKKSIAIFIMTLTITMAMQAKTLIVYYSYTNNVHRIVTALQSQIEADVIRLSLIHI